MNGKMIVSMLGKITLLEALIMTPSLVCSIIYSEWKIVLSFATVMLLCLVIGF